MKRLVVRLIDGLAMVAVSPAYLLYCLGRSTLGPARSFPGWSQAFALIPGLAGVLLRRAFYRLTLAECSPDACVLFGSFFSGPAARIGRGVFVGAYCSLGENVVEDDVLIGSFVSILNGGRQHGFESLETPIRHQPGTWQVVTIGRGSWVGERAVIMADVGSGCVIGAGSVVTRPIPDYAIAQGVPARVVRSRTDLAGQDLPR